MFSPGQIRDQELRDLYAYWRSKHHHGGLPSRHDVDPLEIPRFLKNIGLLHVVSGGMDFVFTLAGSRIEQVHGRSLKGVSIHELHKSGGPTPAVEQYAEVARTAEPRYREGDLKVFGKAHWYGHRLLLPLSDDGERVNTLLLGILFWPTASIRTGPKAPA